MDTYIITAKTVEEAISTAKKQYEDENHEVSYEILEMPKKGLFGIGAKDAKVKITVSKTEKVELGSLVAEMRSMKNLTDRSGSGDSEKSAKKPVQNQQKQPRPQQNQQNQQNQQKQPGQPKEPKPQGDKPQNQPKQQNQPKKQNPQNQPGQPKPQGEKQQNPQNSQNQPKEPKQQNPQNQQPKQPKEPKPADGQNQPKQPREPKPQNQQNQPKEPKPVKTETAAAEAVETAAEKIEKTEKTAAGAEAGTSPLDAAILSATTVSTKFGDAGAEYKSSLHNSSRPNRRTPQKHGSNAEEKIDAGAVTVSQPMGLTDFVADPDAQGFGKNNGNSGNANAGRMNNDVHKKKKNAPKTAGDKKPESTVARYDFAESDDDYEKLDRLVSEAESKLEAAEAAVLVPKMPTEPEEDDSDAEELSSVHEIRRREAITQAEMDYALEFANTLLANMKLSARAVPAECPEGEEFDTTEEATVYPKIDIVGDDTGILIGHHGETLDSIQYLTNLSALRKTKSRDGDYVKIVVDIENYREKREDTLRTLARRMAARAVKYKRNVFLEPMNAYERRIIHSELQSFENVSTHSVGADRDRKIIITYEGPDKQPDNRQNNGGRRRRGDKAPAEESGAASNANADTENGTAKENGGNGRNRRRPRKSQKMPIEKLNELLPGGDESASEAVEAVEAAVGAAEAVETAVEAAETAAEAVETAVETAVVDAPAQPDEE